MTTMHNRPAAFVLSLALAGLLVLPANGATITWNNGAGTMLWSDGGVGGNWSDDDAPDSGDVARFTHLGGAGSAGVVTSVFDSAFLPATIQGLQFNFDGTTPTSYFHTLEIAPGRTLHTTASTGLQVGVSPVSATVTADVTVVGGAGSKLQIGNVGTTGSVFSLGHMPDPSGNTVTANLDLSGLERFEAYVGNFNLANTQRAVTASLTLAESNLIRANTLTLGRAGGSNSGTPSQILLGQENELRISNSFIGDAKSRGIVEFAPGLVNPELVWRGITGGTSRANLTLGRNNLGTSGTAIGTLDVSAGSIDARFTTLTLGHNIQTNTGGVEGHFTMAAGLVDATTVILGHKQTATGNNNALGVLNIGGGEFIAGSMVLGRNDSTSTGSAVGTLNLSGGLLTANTMVLGQDATDTTGIVNLSGGSLKAGTISQGSGDAIFNFTGGQLEFDTFGFTLAQDGGVLTVETGSSTINGNYALNDGLLQVVMDGNTGTALTITGDAILDSDLEVLLGPSFVLPSGPVQILEAGAVIGEFNNRFLTVVSGDAGNLFYHVDYTPTGAFITFSLIPEPGTGLLVAAGICGLLLRRRRNACIA